MILNGATLDASGFTGTGAAIDLSGTASLTFTGTNTLNAGNGSISLPSGFRISGTAPTVTGALSYATEQGAYVIESSPIDFPSTAMGDITTSLNNLMISGNLRSIDGKIDLSNITEAITIQDSVIRADNDVEGAAIDFSNASEFNCTNSTLNPNFHLFKMLKP